MKKTAFVLGNGTSRKSIDLNQLKEHGTVYGCNALYREFNPDYLVAVDAKMVIEINNNKYQHNHEVWTNPNRTYHQLTLHHHKIRKSIHSALDSLILLSYLETYCQMQWK